MSTYILTWNAAKWPWKAGRRRREIERTEAGFVVQGRWATGNRTHDIQPGDRAFLLQQGATRGMVASGWIASEVFQDEHWNEVPGDIANYAYVDWDVVLSDHDMVPVLDLKAEVPQMDWDHIQSSGVRLPEPAEEPLERAWAKHVGTFHSPEEVHQGGLYEGALTRVTVNRYERNPWARQACLNHYGTTCQACGLDFEKMYGSLGKGFIHVHHVVDLATIGAKYEVDPIKDLRPVCPNCHAMLHRETPAMTVDELRTRITRR